MLRRPVLRRAVPWLAVQFPLCVTVAGCNRAVRGCVGLLAYASCCLFVVAEGSCVGSLPFAWWGIMKERGGSFSSDMLIVNWNGFRRRIRAMAR